MKKIIGGLVSGALAATPFLAFAHGGEHMAAVSIWGMLSWPLIVGLAVVAGVLAAATHFSQKASSVAAVSSGVVAMILMGAFVTGIQYTSHMQAMASIAPVEMKMYTELAGASATVYRAPGCECCKGYIAALREQGVEVTMIELTDTELTTLKREKGVTSDLESCHTTVMDEYVIEGHVPFEAIAKLRKERPSITGIALPGMPSGTPGMPGPKTAPYVVKTLEGKEFLTL